MIFRKFQMNENAIKMKYGLTEAVNFIIGQ